MKRFKNFLKNTPFWGSRFFPAVLVLLVFTVSNPSWNFSCDDEEGPPKDGGKSARTTTWVKFV